MEAFLHEFIHHFPAHAASAAVLCVFVTAIAYVHEVHLKTLIYSMPVPFTCAYLATGTPINATHLSGMALVTGYTWLVYLMHDKLRLPLAGCITLGVAFYLVGAYQLRPLAAVPLPWIALPLLLAWLGMVNWYRGRAEPGFRSVTPWYLKLPLIFLIGMVMYSAEPVLKGAVATFPYASTFTSVEMRRNLRALAGRFTINCIGMWSMICVMWLTQGHLAKPWPLVLGWVAVGFSVWMVYLKGLGRPAVVMD